MIFALIVLFQDAFVNYFPDPAEFEDKLWTFGLMTTLGLGALATLFATR